MSKLLCMCALHALFVVCLPFCLTAQTSWSGGIALGPNFSTVKDDTDFRDNQFKAGYSIGFRVACHPGNRLSIQAEALIERKGSQADFQFTDIEGNPLPELTRVKNHMDYLVFPLTLQWRFGNGAFRYGPYAGAYLAKLIQQRSVTEQGGAGSEEDGTDLFQKSDAGAIAGFGAEWKVDESISFSLEGRYSLGLKNYLDFPEGSVINESMHQSMAVLAGLRFSFGQ